MSKFKAVDSYQKGKKTLGATAIYAAIQIAASFADIDLTQYDVLVMDAATMVDSLYVTAVVLFRLAMDDWQNIIVKYKGDMS
jgi:hypothetical protein